MRFSAIVIAAAWVAGSTACLAANANNPYGNVDHRNDAGNDTGDSRVDQLNAAQLDGSAPRPGWQRRPAGYPAYAQQPAYPYGRPAYPPGGYAQPGYAPPGYAQPGYAPPGYAQPGYPPPGY